MPIDYSQPLQKFKQQTRQAKQRGISWELSFEEWMAIWQESGKWELRGKKVGQYVMARNGDIGPYSRGNTYICLASDNHSHAHTNGRVPVRPAAPKPPKVARIVRGWTYIARAKAHPYQVMCGKTYVGCYATQPEAEAAYAAALALKDAAQGGVVSADEGVDSPIAHGPQFCPGEPRNATQLRGDRL